MRALIRTAAMAIVAAGLIGGAATVSSTPANAAGISVRIGDGHHRHWRGHHYGWRHHHRSRCRVVVTHRWHHGHRVTVRKRICR